MSLFLLFYSVSVFVWKGCGWVCVCVCACVCVLWYWQPHNLPKQPDTYIYFILLCDLYQLKANTVLLIIPPPPQHALSRGCFFFNLFFFGVGCPLWCREHCANPAYQPTQCWRGGRERRGKGRRERARERGSGTASKRGREALALQRCRMNA